MPAYSADLGGSVRGILAGLRNYDAPLLFGEDNDYDHAGQLIVRGTVEDSRYEAHVVQTFDASSEGQVVPGVVGLPGNVSRYRVGRGAWTWLEDDERAVLGVDRLNVRHSRGATDVVLGRQAVNFSQAYFWNPLDVFLAFDPAAFDRDYKPGVDALRLDLAIDAFSGLTLVWSPGRELVFEQKAEGTVVDDVPLSDEAWYGAALLVRYRTNVRDWDVAFQGGKVYGGWQLGLGVSGEVEGAGLHAELAAVKARDERKMTFYTPTGPETAALVEDHLALVLGAEYRFENSFYVSGEYLYNGAGEPDLLPAGLARQALGQTVSLGRHLAGLLVSYEFHPLLTAQTSLIHSLSDHSTLLAPTVTWSTSDESELLFGAILGFGDRPSGTAPAVTATAPGRSDILTFLNPQSEYGTWPNVIYLEFKYYF